MWRCPLPAPGAPGLFRCAPEGYLREGYSPSAGLRDVSREEEVIEQTWSSTRPSGYWAFMNDIAAPVVAGLAKADEATREQIRDEVLDLGRRAALHEGAVHMRSTATIVTATR